MAVSYVTQANANSASSQVTSKTVTIPATVQANDVLLLVANCYSGGSGSSTINISSTGTAWTRQGSSTYVAGTSAQNNGSLFYLTAGASDAGKVVTISTATSLFYNITLVVYRGAALPFDGVQITSSTTLTTSDTCPTITTTNSGTWLVCLGSLCNGSAGFSSCTGPSLASTVREANFGSASGIAVASDSNGAVATGSHVPGHFTPSSTADYITWSAGIAPASTGTSVNAGVATATGTAQDATGVPAIAATAGLATGTSGAALLAGPAVGVTAGLAAGTGTAQNATGTPAVTATAGLATGTGTARGIGSSFSLTAAGLATGTAGAALAAALAVGVTAGRATATGTAQTASVSTAGNVNVSAARATGTGTAQGIGQSAGITAGRATGTGTADTSVSSSFVAIPGLAVPGLLSPGYTFIRYSLIPAIAVTAGLATGTGTARTPTPGRGANAGLAAGTGTVQPAVPAPGVTAGLGTGTGTAQDIGQSARFAAGRATGTAGTAQNIGQSASFTAGLVTGTGTAFNGVISSVISPVLTASGFGSFPQVPAGAVVLSVVAAIVQHGSNAGIGVPSYELWDGTSARIGAVQFGTVSTTAGHTDSVVFTGVSYSQLATLQLRIYATSQSGNSGATVSVDAVSLSVSWVPGVDATAAPVVLAVVPVVRAPAVSVTASAAVTPDVLIIVPVFPDAAAGFEAAAVFPGALAVIPVFPHAAAAAGTKVTPGVLAVVPAFPAITDITVPGWASADSSGGSWANPGNILGPPDGSYAVWTVP